FRDVNFRSEKLFRAFQNEIISGKKEDGTPKLYDFSAHDIAFLIECYKYLNFLTSDLHIAFYKELFRNENPQMTPKFYQLEPHSLASMFSALTQKKSETAYQIFLMLQNEFAHPKTQLLALHKFGAHEIALMVKAFSTFIPE